MKHAAELLTPLDDSWQRLSSVWKKAQRKPSESAIHDFRVACRRFIARLDMASAVLDNDDARPARKGVKKTLKRMGPLRDLHVQMETVAALSDSQFAKDFKKELKRNVTRTVSEVVPYLRENRRERLRKRVEDLTTALEHHAERLSENAVRQPIDRLVGTRLHEYLNARDQFAPGNETTLHTMRIALKKLRYAVEAAPGMIGGWDEDATLKMQAAQRLMGETRDIQILIKQLQEWAVSQKREAEAAGILKRLEKRRNNLIARIARSARAMDEVAPKELLTPMRETTRAASQSQPVKSAPSVVSE